MFSLLSEVDQGDRDQGDREASARSQKQAMEPDLESLPDGTAGVKCSRWENKRTAQVLPARRDFASEANPSE
jgi:hypothetical protein